MLNSILKNKKIVMIIIALILVSVIAVVAIKGFSDKKRNSTGNNTEQSDSQTEKEPYDGDGLDVVEPDADEKEDSTSVDGSWDKDPDKKPSSEKPKDETKDNANNDKVENGNSDTDDEDNVAEDNDTDKKDEDVAEDDKSWGTIF